MAIIKKISISCLVFALLIPAAIYAQSKNDKTVVGTVGNEKVTYAEVINNYSAGNSKSFSLEELESFLPLYLDYKAKLISAKDNGYYKDSTLLAEHDQYAKQAALAYWLDKEIRPSVFEKFYQRAIVELKSFHVLIAVDKNATSEKIEEVKEKLQQAKKEIENGVPLEEVDREYSTKRNGRSMGGDLPWLSVGRTVKEFENVVYNLEIGEISEPFASQFGYHIVILQDKRDRTPARLTNHIYVRATQDSAAHKKINEAYDYLERGKNWTEVMQEFSEDDASKGKNGSIGWVSYHSNFAAPFIDAVNKVDAALDFSEPVRTNYGYHIFKIDSVQTFETEEDRKKEIMEELKKSNYYQENNEFVINYLQEKFSSTVAPEVLDEYKSFVSDFDTTSFSDITLPSSLSSKPVYAFRNNDISVAEFHAYILENHSDKKAKNYKSSWFDDYKNHVVDSQVIDLTLENYPEFAQQSESYLNGLVVYKINDDFVWNAATVDSTRLMEIYEQDPETYSYNERPHYYLISATHDSTLGNVKTFIENGNSLDSIRVYHKRVSVSTDSTSSYYDEPFDRLSTMEPGTFSEVFDHNKRKAIFYLKEKLPARKMTFEEAFNRLVARHQPEREEAWLKQLRAEYKVKPNLKNLQKAYKKDTQASK